MYKFTKNISFFLFTVFSMTTAFTQSISPADDSYVDEVYSTNFEDIDDNWYTFNDFISLKITLPEYLVVPDTYYTFVEDGFRGLEVVFTKDDFLENADDFEEIRITVLAKNGPNKTIIYKTYVVFVRDSIEDGIVTTTTDTFTNSGSVLDCIPINLDSAPKLVSEESKNNVFYVDFPY